MKNRKKGRPNYHGSDSRLQRMVSDQSEKGKKENTVLEVFEKGYRYKDRVIRHAKVVVNQTPS